MIACQRSNHPLVPSASRSCATPRSDFWFYYCPLSPPSPTPHPFQTKYSYLDTVGRPVLVLKKKNLVAQTGAQLFEVRGQCTAPSSRAAR